MTAKYLDRCVATGLFGVTLNQVNFLANVSAGDVAFLLETGTGRIVGPFMIQGGLFYSETPVWSSASEETDSFTYRVRLVGADPYSADISALWSILLRRKGGAFFTFTTFQRSALSLLPGESDHLATAIREIGSVQSATGCLEVAVKPLDLLQRDDRIFKSEARLEASILLARKEFLGFLQEEGHIDISESYTLLNQVTLPGLNYNIDILALANEHVIIVELKKDAIDRSACEQVRRYARYFAAAGNRTTLIAVGAASATRIEDPLVSSYQYHIDRQARAVVLRRANQSWYLPVMVGA